MNEIFAFGEKSLPYKSLKPYWHHLLIAICIFITHLTNTRAPSFVWSGTYLLLLLPSWLLFYSHYLICMPLVARYGWKHSITFGVTVAELAVYMGISNVIVGFSGSFWSTGLTAPGSVNFLELLYGTFWFLLMSATYYYYYEVRYINIQKAKALKKLCLFSEVISKKERDLLMYDDTFLMTYTTMKYTETDENIHGPEVKETFDGTRDLINYVLYASENSKVLVSAEISQLTNLINFIEYNAEEKLDVKIVATANYQDLKIIPLIYLNLVARLLRSRERETSTPPAEIYIEPKANYLRFKTKYVPESKALKHIKKELNQLKRRLARHYDKQFTLTQELDEQGYLVTVLRIEVSCLCI